ncbi:hypothetical protein IMCC3135_31730 [Granulosicoccus antarcticus IMCC3135]|uniref:Uncharacterized protein n=1 Tax=Granulosicoccus antarcticus IMCC3135 TaxID=1192854 RepID=A0A2Z2NYK2_9GAMM|nr:hypothetical protein IMCC3135_31730 [Granulosicoccus antarcticus IMCC3135]
MTLMRKSIWIIVHSAQDLYYLSSWRNRLVNQITESLSHFIAFKCGCCSDRLSLDGRPFLAFGDTSNGR